MNQESHQGGSQESQIQPHGQDDAPQGVSHKRGGLDKEERSNLSKCNAEEGRGGEAKAQHKTHTEHFEYCSVWGLCCAEADPPTRDVKRHSLRNALLITLTGDREKTAMWRLDDCDVGGQTICLQAIPARLSCAEILEWVGE